MAKITVAIEGMVCGMCEAGGAVSAEGQCSCCQTNLAAGVHFQFFSVSICSMELGGR